MNFDKKFTIEIVPDYKKNPEDDEMGCEYGKIVIGDFYEHFYMSPSVWSIDDYRKQWNLAWKHLEINDTSIFVVNVQSDPMIWVWGMYKENDIIFIQNYLFIDEYYQELIGDKPYIPETSFNFLPVRNTEPIEGFQVSEWQIKILR